MLTLRQEATSVTWRAARLWVSNGLVLVPTTWVENKAGFNATRVLSLRGEAPRERALEAHPVHRDPSPRRRKPQPVGGVREHKHRMSWQVARARDWDASLHMRGRFDDATRPRCNVDSRLEDGFALLDGEPA